MNIENKLSTSPISVKDVNNDINDLNLDSTPYMVISKNSLGGSLPGTAEMLKSQPMSDQIILDKDQNNNDSTVSDNISNNGHE